MTLQEFFSSLRDICLLRRGPEDMPYAPSLLAGLVVASWIVDALFERYRHASLLLVPVAMAGTLAVLGALLLLVRWRHKPERFVQTALALIATSLLFQLVAMPLVVVVMPLLQPASAAASLPEPTGGQALAALALLAVGVWQICISVNILRRALEIPVVGGVLVLLLLGFVNLMVASIGGQLIGVG